MVSWHIEPTSKCVLECPLCDRTVFYERFKKRELHEINIKDIVNFLGKNAQVTMCGNNGDPIYHSEFFQLCEKLKEQDAVIHICTNASGKNKTWWSNLVKILDHKDKITFAVDGLEDTNHVYRKNAKWHTIIDAMKICAESPIQTVWKFIIFKHNQHQIDTAKEYSIELGIDEFQLEKSDRWLGNTDLMPDDKFVDQRYTYKKDVVDDKKVNAKINPVCMKDEKPQNQLYIDSAGNFYPCCWQGVYGYRHNDIFDPRKNKFHIKDFTADTILEHPEVKQFFSKIFDYEKVNKCCKIYCGVKNG